MKSTLFCFDALFVLLTCAVVVNAQQPFWQYGGGYALGQVNTVTADADGFVFSAADFIPNSPSGSSGGISKRDLIGSQSARVGDRLGGKDVKVLVAANNGFLFAGTNGAGLFRSTNKGETWQPVAANGPINVLTMIVANNGTLYVGTNDSPGTLFRSTDNGDHWEKLFTKAGAGVNAVAVGVNGYIYVGAYTAAGGVYRSTDDGKEWEAIADWYATALEMAPNGDVVGGRRLDVGGDYFAGVVRSTDNGVSWEGVFAVPGVNGASALLRQFVVLPNGEIYAGVQNHGVLHSTDNGATWSSLEFDFDPNDPQEVGAYDIQSIAYSTKTRQLFLAAHYGLVTSIPLELSTAVDHQKGEGASYHLNARPNIVEDLSIIFFSIPEKKRAKLVLYNVRGELVAVIADALFEAGEHTLSWGAEDIPDGVYYCRLEVVGSREGGETISIVKGMSS